MQFSTVWRVNVLVVGTGHHQAAAVGAGRRACVRRGRRRLGHERLRLLVNGGFDDPKSESSQAQQLIDDRIGGVTADVVVLFRNPAVTVEDPAYRTMVDTARQQFPVGTATVVHIYWDTRSPDFVSTDRHVTFVAVSLKDRNEIIKTTAYDPLETR